VAFSFPALILGVILPQALDGALRTASMVAGAVFFIAAVVSFLGVMKAAERDFKER
jgi:ABC-type dipeptide/oligopeptide/nickel transport system permease subunit